MYWRRSRNKHTLFAFVSILLSISMIMGSLSYGNTYAAELPGEVALEADLGVGNTGNIRVLEFDITPTIDNVDAVIGITGNSVLEPSVADFPIAISLNGGTIHVADGATENMIGVVSGSGINVAAGGKYHVKTVINLPGETYDVWVTPPSGTPILVAQDAAFVGGAGEMNDIGKVYSITFSEGGCTLENVRLIQNSFVSEADYGKSQYLIESDNTKQGPVVFKFDYVCAKNKVDALVSLMDSSVPFTAWADLAFILHTEVVSGIFDVRNDNAYTWVGNPDNPYNIEAGTKYHIKMAIDLSTKKYNLWIAKEGQAARKMTDDYKTRNYAAATAATPTYPLNNLNKIVVYGADGDAVVSNSLMLDAEVMEAAVTAVNNAATAEAMEKALVSTALGFSLDKYSAMSDEGKNLVAQDLMNGKPYADDMAILTAFENSVGAHRDLLPPEAPANVHATATNNLQCIITWDEAYDDAEVVCYKVFRNGEEIATVSGTSYTDSNLSPSTTYNYSIKAYDTMLRESQAADAEPVTTCEESGIALFPFSQSVINTAFEQSLLKYKLTDTSYTNPATGQKYKYIMEWTGTQPYSANAMKYLAIASMYSPDYLGPDGITTVTERALEQIRSVITGGNEISCAGDGLASQGYLPVLQTFTVAKLKAPAIWNALTEAEKAKIDLIMEAAFIGSHFCYSDKNNNATGIDQSQNFGKEWNPNHRAGIFGAILASYYFGVDSANSKLKNFDYDAFMERLTSAGFTNIKTVFENTGKEKLEADTKNDDAEGYTYKGHSLDKPELWVKELAEYAFSIPVSPVGGKLDAPTADYPDGYLGYLMDGYDEYPNLGASYMGFEFDARDGGLTGTANTQRSSLHYVVAGWKPILEGIYAIQTYGTLSGTADDQTTDDGLTIDEWNDLMSIVDIGTTDMIYKGKYGYRIYALGYDQGVLKLDDPASVINKDIWYNIVNNPLDGVASVNEASDVTSMKAAVEAKDLYMVLYGYDALNEAQKSAVINAVLSGRPSLGYANKEEIQQTVYNAVKVEGLKQLNAAATTEDMKEALESKALGLYIPAYYELDDAMKPAVLQGIIDSKPQDGYTDKASVRTQVGISLAVPLVNGANTVFAMQTALTSDKLSLNLTEYNDLTDLKQNNVAERMINNRPEGGYAGKAAIQTALGNAISIENETVYPVEEVNNALNVQSMREAVKNPELGLDLMDYDAVSSLKQAEIAQILIDERPGAGYVDSAAVQTALYGAVLKATTTEPALVNSAADGFIHSGNVTQNNGTLTYMTVKDGVGYNDANGTRINATDRKAYIKFSLDSSLIEAIASGTLAYAKVRLSVSGVTLSAARTSATFGLYGVSDSSWEETALTWSNAPAPDENPIVTFELTSSDAGSFITCDITDYIKEQLAAGATSISLAIAGSNVPGDEHDTTANFNTKENGTAQNRPVLQIALKKTDAPVEAVNQADLTGDMKTALEAADLGLDLTGYNALTEIKKNMAVHVLIDGRPSGGYADKTEIQDALNNAVSAEESAEYITEDISCSADAHIQRGNATGNFGTATDIIVKDGVGYRDAGGNWVEASSDREAYFKYDISQSVIDEIASGTVAYGGIRLYVGWLTPSASTPTGNFGVFDVSDTTWEEGTINWSNAPARGVTPIATFKLTSVNAGSYITCDITDYVAEQVAKGYTSISVAIAGIGGEGAECDMQVAFRSKEHGTVANRSLLQIAIGEAAAPEPEPVVKTGLEEAIATAQDKYDEAVVGTQPGQYPQAAKNELGAAIVIAQGIFSSHEATQEEVDQAVGELNAAVVVFMGEVIEESEPEPTSTATPEPTSTATPEPTSTATPEPTSTATPEPTLTATPEPTSTPTPNPTSEPTPNPTSAPAPNPTSEPTPNPTSTPIPSPTPELLVKASELRDVVSSGSDYSVEVKDESGRLEYSWTFTKENLERADENALADIKLGLIVSGLDANEEINSLLTGKNENQTGLIISFEHEGTLSVQAAVRIYVGALGIDPNSMVYLYYYNPATRKLDILPYTSKGIQVDKDGYITVNIVHCSDYVILPDKADVSTYTGSLAQITLSPNKLTLYTGDTKYSKGEIKVTMPSTFELVNNLKDKTSGTAVGAVTITYKSSNTKVATVDSNGVITAKGKGNTKITASIKLYSGLTKTFTTTVTVKEPSIKITKSTDTMKFGSTYTFKATLTGYDKKDIVWMTSKRDIVVINKKTGKATAKTKGTDYVEVRIDGQIVKLKVVVK